MTTGLFPVPGLPAALGTSVDILVSSFQDEEAPVVWSVDRAEMDGSKVRLQEGTLQVPGQGMDSVTLPPHVVEGRVIEVNMTLPSLFIQPSVAVVVTFLVDESRQIALWLSPQDFALRRTARFGNAKLWRARAAGR